MDMPLGSGGSSSSSSGYHQQATQAENRHQKSYQTNDVLDGISRSTANLIKTAAAGSTDLKDVEAVDSPSYMDMPRTPSPNASIATPPLAVAAMGDMNSLKIPLKYQRKSKSSSEKHYKKKFCERNWEYDADDIMEYSSNSSRAADAAGTNTNPSNDLNSSSGSGSSSTHSKKSPKDSGHHHHHHNHKSSKFRPKGKDWDWSTDGTSQHGNNNGSSSSKSKLELGSNSAASSVA